MPGFEKSSGESDFKDASLRDSLSLTPSLCSVSPLSNMPSPPTVPWHLQAYILHPSNNSFSFPTLFQSPRKVSQVHLVLKPILDPVTVAMREWNKPTGQICITSKEAIVYKHNGILLSHKKEQNNAMCSNMNAAKDYYTK